MTHEDPQLQPLLDAATTFAMELEAASHYHAAGFSVLDRQTALSELARLSGYRPEILREAQRAVDVDNASVAALLGVASAWVVFATDD
jgi:hypothetical protein